MQNTEQTQQYTRHDLAKKYHDGETKEQRKQRKALDKLVKHDQELGLYDIPYNANPLIKDKYYVLCLKHGAKYSSEYVNRLYNMVQRNCTLDYEFVCLTENPKDLNPNIKTIPLPGNLQGWWCKPYMFTKSLPLKGTVLYLDLDVVIAGNIDKLFTHAKGHWCTIRDFTRVMRKDWQKYNSSVVRFQVGQLDHVWENFKKDPITIQKRLHGDQDWLYEATRTTPAMLYPDSWIQSWKWEVRKSRTFERGGTRGNRTFEIVEHDAVPRVECCVCVFHGDPNPALVKDKWVVDNWQ